MSEPAKAVFLSYAREDAEAAKRIAEALRGFGVEVWFDMSELRGGDQWDQKIRGQIKACGLFIPVISATTQSRDEAYFRLEWKLADDRSQLMAPGKVFIVPVAIDATPENGAAVPDSFSRAQWIRLPGGGPTPQFVEQVKRLLAGKVSPGGSGSPFDKLRTPSQSRGRPTAAGSGDPDLQKKSLPGWTWGAGLAVVVGGVVAAGVFRQPKAVPPVPTASVEVKPMPMQTVIPRKADKSIAILPFANRSENKADLFFTDGIHDDLLTQISRIKDIKTISRTSVMAYRDSPKNMRTIGAELGVATLLEGGVQRAGNQVRINVQLIDAATDAHLWAETYTRDLTAENIFAIQSEIAGAIAKALKGVLSPEEQKQLEHVATTNFEALEKYFQANALSRETNTASLERAIVHYQEAIHLDGRFAPAYAGLAGVYLNQINLSGLPQDVQTSLAEPLIEQALRLDPQLSDAFVARGGLLYFRGDIPGAKAALERAIELKPNSEMAHLYLANLLFSDLNEREKGLAMLLRAQELSPEDANVKRALAGALNSMDRYPEARAILEKLIRENPSDVISLAALGYFDCGDGKIVGGFTALRKAYAMDPGNAVVADNLLQVCIDILGDPEWIKFWLERSVAATRVGKVPLNTRIRLLIAQGKLAEADALWVHEWDQGAPASVLPVWELMLADIKAGRKLAPRARYLKTNPELFAPGAKVTDTSDGLFRAKDVALALLAAGEREQAELLLTQAEKLARGHTDWVYGFILAKIQLARGDRAGFFQTLRGMVAKKESLAYLYNDPEFAVYRDDPEFLALFGDLPRQRAEMIATLHRMDASGELAPVPPLPEAKK